MYRSGTINDKNWGPFRRMLFPASLGYMTATQIKGWIRGRYVKDDFSLLRGSGI